MFIEIEVKTAIIVHGYDTNNQEIIEELNEEDFIKKIVSIDRIQSISEKYILVSSSHERVMYWEYKGSMEEIKLKLINVGIPIA
ncbi:MAG: hypothetical protein KTR26_03720 [Flammeovirgaceae bacterium]|nr:hypothetical protein [Flammeovirgaceae bacterium]